MKISVITPSYNQADFIKETLQSVAHQGFDGELEHIVIDGGSTDGTIDILKNHSPRLKWISEKDNGQADAINKGVKLATGNLIGWLNSDDVYIEGALQQVCDFFNKNPNIKWAYGKCKIVDANGKEIWKSITTYKNLNLKKFSYNSLLRENYISQPAVFFRKEIFTELGPLNPGLNYAMDYDLWLRFGKKYPAGVIPEYLACFRRHQTSKSDTGFKAQFLEQFQVAKQHGAGKLSRIIHYFNIYKIIFSYQLINSFTVKSRANLHKKVFIITIIINSRM